MADNIAEEENPTETEEKIEYPLEVQYCGGNQYFPSLLGINFVEVVMSG